MNPLLALLIRMLGGGSDNPYQPTSWEVLRTLGQALGWKLEDAFGWLGNIPMTGGQPQASPPWGYQFQTPVSPKTIYRI